jgi:hypothetical protein
MIVTCPIFRPKDVFISNRRLGGNSLLSLLRSLLASSCGTAHSPYSTNINNQTSIFEPIHINTTRTNPDTDVLPPPLGSHQCLPNGLVVVNPDGPHPILELIGSAEKQWNVKLDGRVGRWNRQLQSTSGGGCLLTTASPWTSASTYSKSITNLNG